VRIVVTGGSRGIGRMLAAHLAGSHEVVVVSKSKKSVDAAKKELGVAGYVADVSRFPEVKKAFGKAGAFDALINCAGILGPVGRLEDTGMRDWEETVAVNLFGTVNCCKAALPVLKARGGGRIINVSGGGAAYPRPFHSAYAASKAAVVRFTENLAEELRLEGARISVNAIAPGTHKTDMWKEETAEKPPREWADPDLLYALVDFLLSDGGKGVSGRFIHFKDDYRALAGAPADMMTLRRIDGRLYGRI
jgi:NAD(P)-dependent dehydrogenase (short-subunit alcohol dehydrogenase family)